MIEAPELKESIADAVQEYASKKHVNLKNMSVGKVIILHWSWTLRVFPSGFTP